MAPDINSLSPAASRPSMSRSSTHPTSATDNQSSMGLPTVPSSAVHQTNGSTSNRSSNMRSSETTGVPLRHPRPLTAAELYDECEKEQEAMVNRLTRELSALRAQSASVVSSASHSSVSTSASLLGVDVSDHPRSRPLTGPTHPTPSRNRSSSSVSSRSNTAATSVLGAANPPYAIAGTTQGVSQAFADRATAANGRISRQPSISASGASTPARRSMDMSRQNTGTLSSHQILPNRSPVPRDPTSNTAQSLGHGINSAMQHYAEATTYRAEMEAVKAENEALRNRVRALEQALRVRRRDSSQSDAARPVNLVSRTSWNRDSSESLRSPLPSPVGVAAWAAGDGGVGGVAGPRERSESQSTTASSRRPVGIADEELKVGESAGSAASGR